MNWLRVIRAWFAKWFGSKSAAVCPVSQDPACPSETCPADCPGYGQPPQSLPLVKIDPRPSRVLFEQMQGRMMRGPETLSVSAVRMKYVMILAEINKTDPDLVVAVSRGVLTVPQAQAEWERRKVRRLYGNTKSVTRAEADESSYPDSKPIEFPMMQNGIAEATDWPAPTQAEPPHSPPINPDNDSSPSSYSNPSDSSPPSSSDTSGSSSCDSGSSGGGGEF